MATYKSIYVTFKATLKCNLACQYCYGRENHATGAEMTESEIRQGLRFVRDYTRKVGAKQITICWHGGEPLLLAKKLPGLIEYANELFAEIGVKAMHGAQTNATLLLPGTYRLIKQYFDGFVGVSIDLFSNYRTFPNGTLSTDVAVRNIDAAIAAGIRCGAINLVTKDNYHRMGEIYSFYKERNMNVRLPRVFPIDKNDDMTSDMYLTDEQYAEAMITFFDLWANDPQPADNTDIVKLVADLLLGSPSICLREESCHERYLALSPGGDIFSCAEFDVPEAVIGNFLTQSPEEFINSDARNKLAALAPIPEKCSSCRYRPTCYGGCFRERFMLGYSYRCEGNKLYWDHVVEWIESKGGALYILKDRTPDERRAVVNKIFGRR